MNKILLFLLQRLIVLLVRYEKTWKPTWRRIKDLFAKNPKMAHVVMCKNCEHQFWGKTKFRYSECPNCEAECLIVNPSQISIKERERMWRFLNDDDMETSAELDHDELMEESFQDMDYEGHWGDTPCAYAHEMAEKVREDLR